MKDSEGFDKVFEEEIGEDRLDITKRPDGKYYWVVHHPSRSLNFSSSYGYKRKSIQMTGKKTYKHEYGTFKTIIGAKKQGIKYIKEMEERKNKRLAEA